MITLYHAPHSRSAGIVWLLEELGAPYEVKLVDFNAPRSAEHLALNPSGKVPILIDGPVVMTESAAIALYLADKFGLGTLAPALDDPDRARYLMWMVFVVAAAEPAFLCAGLPERPAAAFSGWGTLEAVIDRLSAALVTGPWLLGERFTAADILVNGVVRLGFWAGHLPKRAEFEGYAARGLARTACQKAIAFDTELTAAAR